MNIVFFPCRHILEKYVDITHRWQLLHNDAGDSSCNSYSRYKKTITTQQKAKCNTSKQSPQFSNGIIENKTYTNYNKYFQQNNQYNEISSEKLYNLQW